MRIAIYSRKSRWTGRGDSVENQVSMCREYIQKYLLPGFSSEKANENGLVSWENSQNSGGIQSLVDVPEILVYEDEGFSGKNTNRPEFQRMMKDIQEQKYDYLICYRLDRLGRNMIDLATLVEELNRREVSFISIKEQFDTSTPMGKAMLYFAGVLAQMEREQIAERVRDNMLMLARSGRWLGGNTPLGFVSAEEKSIQMDGKVRRTWRLQVKEEEIPLVKMMFQLYLEKQSLGKVAGYLQMRQIRTRKNRDYTVTAVRDILRNPVYCSADAEGYEYFYNLGCQVCMEPEEAVGKYGLICYAKTVSGHKENPPEKWILAAGKHPGIIAGKDFVRVQKLLEKNSSKGKGYHIHNEMALFSGLLYCSCGYAMRPKYYGDRQKQINPDEVEIQKTDIEEADTEEMNIRRADKEKTDKKRGNIRRFSYICPCKYQTHKQSCQVSNIQGNMLDQQVCQEIFQYLEKMTDWKDVLKLVYGRLNDLPDDVEVLEMDSEAVILKQRMEEKQAQIQNLIYSLAQSAASPEFVQQVEKQIQVNKTQIQQLEKEYERFNQMSGKVENEQLFQSLSAFSEIFKELSIPQKREFLKQVIERIVWDGEVLELHLKVSVSCSLHYRTRWDRPAR